MAGARKKEPAFITYLMSPDLDHDCYFLVGNKQHKTIEKIGAVKKMLLAHSVMLRNELQDSKMSEKGVVRVEDLFPDTFRNLLKYVYGYDNISCLSFDDADNLLYAAEKYLMNPLKAKLSDHLISLLDVNNICSLLNNPACFKVLELDCAITEILQFETDKVLANSLFLDLCPNALIKILEQDILNVDEIELWRAAVKWGKHRVDSEDDASLRKELSEPMKHIRILTFDCLTFCREVVPTKVLTHDEVVRVCTSYGEGVKPVNVTGFSCKTELRNNSQVFEMKLDGFTKKVSVFSSTLILDIKACGIVLLPMKFTSICQSSNSRISSTTKKIFTIEITEISLNPHTRSSRNQQGNILSDRTLNLPRNTVTPNPTISVDFDNIINLGDDFEVPIIECEKNVILLPNKKYKLEVFLISNVQKSNYQKSHQWYAYTSYSRDHPLTYTNDHFSLTVCNSSCNPTCIVPVSSLQYRTVKM